jgi:glucokinase
VSDRRGAVVAVDIGGTTLKAMAVDGSGTVLDRRVVATPAGAEAVVDGLVTVVGELRDALTERGLPLTRLGVACPGVVDPVTGRVAFAANLGWHGLPLRDHLTARFGVEVAIENDARTGAIAEHALARPADADDLAFVPVGTGVAAAYYVAGVLARGATTSAGELGHVTAVHDGELCTCGRRGCVEVYTSAANILARYTRRGGVESSTPAIIAAVPDDALAAQVWHEAIDALAVGLASVVTLLDPSRIVIGGGLSLAGDELLVPLRRRLAREVAWRAAPPLDTSLLGSHSTLVGAALLGWQAAAGDVRDAVRRLAGQLHEAEGLPLP